MRISFTADTATFDEIEGALIAGLAVDDGSQEYLIFQRSLPNNADDWGVYLEYRDQVNSAYNVIANCSVSHERIVVKLSNSLGNLNNITELEVELKVDEPSYKRFLLGLKQVFRGDASSQLIINH